MSVDKLFETNKWDRDDYFNEKWDEWSRDDLLAILERADISVDALLVGSIALHPQSSVDDLKLLALSGKYTVGVIYRVLLNDNCTEEIIRELYNKASDNKIFEATKKENIKNWGEKAWDEYKEGYVTKINNYCLEHKNCPDDLK